MKQGRQLACLRVCVSACLQILHREDILSISPLRPAQSSELAMGSRDGGQSLTYLSTLDCKYKRTPSKPCSALQLILTAYSDGGADRLSLGGRQNVTKVGKVGKEGKGESGEILFRYAVQDKARTAVVLLCCCAFRGCSVPLYPFPAVSPLPPT